MMGPVMFELLHGSGTGVKEVVLEAITTLLVEEASSSSDVLRVAAVVEEVVLEADSERAFL